MTIRALVCCRTRHEDHAMKDKKRIEILLKFIKKVYDKNPDLQRLIKSSMVEICAEEGTSLQQVFFVLVFFAVAFIVMVIQTKGLKT